MDSVNNTISGYHLDYTEAAAVPLKDLFTPCFTGEFLLGSEESYDAESAVDNQ